MSRSYPTGRCARCQQTRAIKARGLCSGCHSWAIKAGHADQYAPTAPDTQSKVLPHAIAGRTPAEAARALGITRNAANCAYRALRQKGLLVPADHDTPTHEKLRHQPPPAAPACAGVDPQLFTEFGNIKEFMSGSHPATWAQIQIQAAFAYCVRCPVRDWCENEAVRPRAFGATIIAGGALWINGRKAWTLEDQDWATAKARREEAAA